MLVHIGQPEVAERVHNAWLRTIEDGIHTYDIFTEGVSKQKVGTKEFAQAVVARLGQEAQHAEAGRLTPRRRRTRRPPGKLPASADPKVDLVGVDVYVNWPSLDNDKLAAVLQQSGRRRSGAHHDVESRREDLAGRPSGDVLHRQLPLPLRRVRTASRRRRSSACWAASPNGHGDREDREPAQLSMAQPGYTLAQGE